MNIVKKTINKILKRFEYNKPWEFKKAVYSKLKTLKINQKTPIKVLYVKGFTGKKSNNIVLKEAMGVTNVSYHKLLKKNIRKLKKKSYLYRLIKHQLNLNSKRSWGDNLNNTIIKHNRKKYINAIIKRSVVIRGSEEIKKGKRKSNSARIAEKIGLNSRTFNLKNVLSIKIGKNTFKNKNLSKKIFTKGN